MRSVKYSQAPADLFGTAGVVQTKVTMVVAVAYWEGQLDGSRAVLGAVSTGDSAYLKWGCTVTD